MYSSLTIITIGYTINNNRWLYYSFIFIFLQGGIDIISKDEKLINIDDYPQQHGNHIFDDAFLSACVWDKRLLIPLINEAFGLDIPEDAEIINQPRESFVTADNNNSIELIKRITDALVKIDNGIYHFECESKNDGKILIRVAEYDVRIAINDAEYNNYQVKVKLPNTAVVFVRNHKKLPASGEIQYILNDRMINETVPFVKVSDYDLDYLTSKHLFILYPFYLVRYEHALANNVESKMELIEKEACRVYNELTKAYDIGILTKQIYEKIMSLCNHVLKHISRNSYNQERLAEAMGTGVLLSFEEIGEHNGRIKGRAEGERIANLERIQNALKNSNMTFDEVCNLLGIEDPEEYRNLI